MNEKKMSIKQLRYITQWTYPTAFKFAKANGAKDEDGRWMVPANSVSAYVHMRVDNALGEQALLYEVLAEIA